MKIPSIKKQQQFVDKMKKIEKQGDKEKIKKELEKEFKGKGENRK